MRRRFVAAVVRAGLTASVLSLTSVAFAEETPTKGAAVLSLSGQVGVLDPGAAALEHHAGGGAGFEILLRRLEWPVFVGFGAGILMFDASMSTQVTTETTIQNGNIRQDTTYYYATDHTAELRHAELLVRFQPFWGIVRPYVEGLVGVGGVVETFDRPEMDGSRTAGVAGLFGATLGIDWRLHSWGDGEWGLILTTGVQRLFTTPVTRPTFTSLAAASTDNDPLKMWVPFLGIGLAGKSGTASK